MTLLQQGTTHRYCDPLLMRAHDFRDFLPLRFPTQESIAALSVRSSEPESGSRLGGVCTNWQRSSRSTRLPRAGSFARVPIQQKWLVFRRLQRHSSTSSFLRPSARVQAQRRPPLSSTSAAILTMTQLHWLPNDDDWRARLARLRQKTPANQDDVWREAVALANLQMDFVRTNALDQVLRAKFNATSSNALGISSVRLALLGSCTMAHLQGAIRIAGIRRGIWITIYENDYGQYYQELADPESALHAFNPTVLLLAQDAYHLTEGVSANLDVQQSDSLLEERSRRIAECWRLARKIQLPDHPTDAPSSAFRPIGTQ